MYWAVMVLDVMVLAATAVPQSRAAPSTTAAAREMSFVLFFFHVDLLLNLLQQPDREAVTSLSAETGSAGFTERKIFLLFFASGCAGTGQAHF